MEDVQYQHFKLKCRKNEKESYAIWIVQSTGCVVLQKTTQKKYECYLNVLAKTGITMTQFSSSFNPIFAHKVFLNEYAVQLYTIRGLRKSNYAAYRETEKTIQLEAINQNCTKISIYEYDSGTLIQSMYYQMKLDMQHVAYHQYTLSKNSTRIVSTTPFAFFRMVVDVSVLLLLARLEATVPFHTEYLYNIYYISLYVTQCDENSPGMVLVLSAKVIYTGNPWYRDTYKFLDPAIILPIIKIPCSYLDINLYYLVEEATTCIVNIDYRYYPLAMSTKPNIVYQDRDACTFVVSEYVLNRTQCI